MGPPTVYSDAIDCIGKIIQSFFSLSQGDKVTRLCNEVCSLPHNFVHPRIRYSGQSHAFQKPDRKNVCIKMHLFLSTHLFSYLLLSCTAQDVRLVIHSMENTGRFPTSPLTQTLLITPLPQSDGSIASVDWISVPSRSFAAAARVRT
jgi:hypothetical protein